MASYRDRVLADLARWREAGWVSDEGAEAIAASLPSPHRASFAAVMGILGAVLVAAGVVAFFASNWDAIPRIGRLGIAVFVMAAGFGAAGALRNGHHLFAEAALIIAAAGFGGLLALIGQSYSLGHAEFMTVIGIWAGGTLAGALLTGSASLAILGIAGGVAWSYGMVVDQHAALHLPGLMPVIVGGAIAWWLGSAAARQVAFIGLFLWLAVTTVGLAVENDWDVVEVGLAFSLAGLAALAAALALRKGHADVDRMAAMAAWPAAVTALIGLGILQAADKPAIFGAELTAWVAVATVVLAVGTSLLALRSGAPRFVPAGLAVIALAAFCFAFIVPDNEYVAGVIGAAIVIGASVQTVALGRERLVPAGLQLGLIAFGLELLYVYTVTVGTILDTSVVFLTGGALFIALAFVLYGLQQRLAVPEGGAP